MTLNNIDKRSNLKLGDDKYEFITIEFDVVDCEYDDRYVLLDNFANKCNIANDAL